jgi:hypothetical protein
MKKKQFYWLQGRIGYALSSSQAGCEGKKCVLKQNKNTMKMPDN